jgi:hypothetical protein
LQDFVVGFRQSGSAESCCLGIGYPSNKNGSNSQQDMKLGNVAGGQFEGRNQVHLFSPLVSHPIGGFVRLEMR